MGTENSSDFAKALADFRLNDVPAFAASPLEAADTIVTQLHAQLSLLSAAYADAEAAEQAGALTEVLATVPSHVIANSCASLASQAALASFFLQQHRGAL